MITVEQRTTTTVRHEYLITIPANWVEVSKVFSLAAQDMEKAGVNSSWDDAALFTTDGEKIILYWEEKRS